jgi:hypothetical protein
MKTAPGSWDEAVNHPALNLGAAARAAVLADLNARFGPPAAPAVARPPPPLSTGRLRTLLNLCPCLFNQIDVDPTARGIVHLCEVALGAPITSANVHQAFLIQHPKAPAFTIPPVGKARSGGAIMEALCSETLASEGIPAMALGKDGWPVWSMPGHVLLNEGKMAALKALGDILVPCAPTNIVISVKSEVARERLLYSANSIEGVGFGFFREPQEFWTVSRMSLFKRMGFSAIYMPDGTHKAVMDHLAEKETTRHAVNVNGTDLYRPLSLFGGDMLRVVGKSSTLL